MSEDTARIVRWLLGLAEATVTANGSRATFVSDMYFEAAAEIERLKKNLDGRDKFIVDQGLWLAFVDQLDARAALSDYQANGGVTLDEMKEELSDHHGSEGEK